MISGEQRKFNDIDLLRRRCRFADAERALVDAVATGLDSARLRVLWGRVALDRGRTAVALKHFEKAVALDPQSDEAHAWRVAGLEQTCRYEEALEAARTALGELPDSVGTIRIALGRVLLTMDRLNEALEQFESAYVLAPGDADILEWLIIGLRRLGRFDKAEALAAEALHAHPDHSALLYALARIHEVLGRPADALAQFEEILRRNPWHQDAWCHRINGLRILKRFDEAEKAAAEAIDALPESIEVWVAYSLLAENQDRYDEALNRIEQALAIDPDHPAALEWHIDLLERADRLSEAEAVAASTLDRYPDDPRFLVECAWVFHRLSRIDEALVLTGRAIEADPYYAYAGVTQALLLRTAGRLPEAERSVRESLRCNLTSSSIRLQLIYLLRQQKSFAEAEEEIQRALETEPSDTHLHRVRTELLWSQNRQDDAVDEARAVVDRFPQEPELYYQLGQVHLDRDEYAEAQHWFERTLEIAPAHAGALEYRVVTLRLAGQLSRAEGKAREGLQRRSLHPGLHEELALVQTGMGRPEAALTTLRESLSACGEKWYLRNRLVEQYLLLGKYDEALRETDLALQREPHSYFVVFARIRVLLIMRRFRDAEGALARGLERFPDDRVFLRMAARLDRDQGRFDAALTRIRALRERHPADFDPLIDEVELLQRQRRYNEAVSVLRVETARFPQSALLEREISKAYRFASRYEDALESARNARKLDPFNSIGRLQEILALKALGRYTEAEEAALADVKAKPFYPAFKHWLGRIHDETNRYQQALEWFDMALEQQPFQRSTVVAKSAALRSLRRFAEAEQQVRSTAERFPLDRSLRAELGWVLRDRERYSEAEKAFQALLQDAVSPDERAEAWYGLGWVALSQGDYGEAEHRFNSALDDDPLSHETRLGLAWTLLRSGNTKHYGEVERLCLAVLQDDPRDHVAHLCLGVLHFCQQDYPVAEHHLSRSIELHPYRGSYVDLAALYVHLGRFDEAEELLKKTLERDWYDPHAHVELGNLYLQRDLDAAEPGEWSSLAVQRFRQATVISPNSAAASIGLATALWRTSGDLVSAEDTLRFVLKRPDCDRPRWQVMLALARLLVQRGDATQRDDLHQEALSVATDAIELASEEAEPYFLAGVAAYKIGEGGDIQVRPLRHRLAVRHLKKAVRFDPSHAEARRVLALARQNLRVTRGSMIGSAALVGISLVLLVVLWAAFLLRYQITTVMMATLTPVLTAMVAVGFLLPFLVRLKVPGLEAELSASLNHVSAGPTGEVSLGPGRFAGRGSDTPPSYPASLSEGPRGALPRLG